MTERRGNEPPRRRGGDPDRGDPRRKTPPRRPSATDSTRSAAQRPTGEPRKAPRTGEPRRRPAPASPVPGTRAGRLAQLSPAQGTPSGRLAPASPAKRSPQSSPGRTAQGHGRASQVHQPHRRPPQPRKTEPRGAGRRPDDARAVARLRRRRLRQGAAKRSSRSRQPEPLLQPAVQGWTTAGRSGRSSCWSEPGRAGRGGAGRGRRRSRRGPPPRSRGFGSRLGR